jgi:hypothetical protein
VPGRERGRKARHRLRAHRRDRDRELGGLVLDRVEPVQIRAWLLQEAVARAERAFERVDAAHMLGIDGEHQPVEETSALGAGSVEQRVHRGNEPDDAQMVGKCRCRSHRLAVDAALAQAGRIIGAGRLDAGAQGRKPKRALQVGGNRPRPVAFRE